MTTARSKVKGIVGYDPRYKPTVTQERLAAYREQRIKRFRKAPKAARNSYLRALIANTKRRFQSGRKDQSNG